MHTAMCTLSSAFSLEMESNNLDYENKFAHIVVNGNNLLKVAFHFP